MNIRSNDNPWIGLDSYREGQILYGRSREIQDLSMAVFYNRQTVVYGRSGMGKSSLLHAGIFPEARRRGCLPISIRLDHSAETTYRDQLIHAITDAVVAAGGEITDLHNDRPAPQSLWEFFHRYQPRLNGDIVTPLIVIDQFEEIFTLSHNTQRVKAFFEELADFFNDVMPAYLQNDSQSFAVTETGNNLFDGLAINLSEQQFGEEMSCHLVFVLREDYLSYLERYSAHIPALKQNRYGLLPITYRQAQEIITKPREGLVSREVADAIIRQIATDEELTDDTPVDVAILSLFLSRLFEKKGVADTISMQLVTEQGDALLEDFYEEIVAPLDARTVQYLEDVLINADGHRENVTTESLYKNAWLKQATVEELERSHLLRVFSYGSVQRVEFAHDVLCPIVVRRRSQRANLSRLKRSQRMGIAAFFAFVLIAFGTIYISVMMDNEQERLQAEREQLEEMESSMIEKGAQNMIANYDFYGVIQLLINSMNEDDYMRPSSLTARKELFLHQAFDSIYLSRSKYVASIHNAIYYEGLIVNSKSQNLCGLSDGGGRIIILDTRTGSIVHVFSADNSSSSQVFPNRRLLLSDDMYIYMEPDDYSATPSFLTSTFFNDVRISPNLQVVDIDYSDSKCLIIANDTTLLDCYIYGNTRLCIHNVHSKILDAAYSESSDSIALMLSDSSVLLYNALTGERIHNSAMNAIAKTILLKASKRKLPSYEYFDEPKEDGAVGGPVDVNITDYTQLSLYDGLKGEWVITMSDDKKRAMRESFISDSMLTLHKVNKRQEKTMRDHLDTISLSDEIAILQRSYVCDKSILDSIEAFQQYFQSKPNRYLYPLAIDKNQNRVAISLVSFEANEPSTIYGIYPHNGAIFFKAVGPAIVHTLYFTEDDQYLVVNAGEETQMVFYLPPLHQLVDTCKNMFFDWQMTEEERYQTYIHMND